MLPDLDYTEVIAIVEKEIEEARCPKCGDGVFFSTLCFKGKPSLLNPPVLCRDMGHWGGFLSECNSAS